MGITLGGRSSSAKQYITNPTFGQPGDIIFNSTDQQFYGWDGSSWVTLSSPGITGPNTGDNALNSTYDSNLNGIIDNSEKLGNQLPIYYLSRANHTGTQTSSTISDFNSNVDGKIQIPNILRVKKTNILNGEFSSIKDAVDSISLNSSLNRFAIEIYPGIYIEDEIQLKPYVYLIGIGNPVIEALNPTQTMIIASDNSGIFDLEITGANNVLGIGVFYSGNNSGDFICRNIEFGNNYTQCIVYGNGSKTVAEFENCKMTNTFNFTLGFVLHSSASTETNIYFKNLFVEDNSAPYPNNIFNIYGDKCRVYLSEAYLNSGQSGTALNVFDGAYLSLNDCYIKGFDTAIACASIGSSSTLEIYSTIIEGTGISDIYIQDNGAKGSFTGSATKNKISNLSNTFCIFFSDKTSNEFNFLNSLNFNSKDLKDVATINSIPAYLATSSSDGFLSAIDKNKIDNIVNDRYYLHTQNIPSAIWIVNHNFGKKPNVRAESLTGEYYQGFIIEDINLNSLKIIFGLATTGIAYLN